MSTTRPIIESAPPGSPERPDRAARWPMFIVGLLLLNVGVCAVTIIAAATHPVTVEPDYYEKALRWDELRGLEAQAPGAAPEAEPFEPNTEDTDPR